MKNVSFMAYCEICDWGRELSIPEDELSEDRETTTSAQVLQDFQDHKRDNPNHQPATLLSSNGTG